MLLFEETTETRTFPVDR
ncbi:hypothetical protein CAEBREN_09287 [Caenorhabditis brenneri]|uniref:Uncharacterized protein n=1 Tax=Caenorhabditis brenneri TaxID=135651 RepID=G0PJZ5_CAEBE|nr:hypothetical protein CAEBREN_09287 [Caenorhabditis brenneri]